jgi:hypothetical protein
MPNFSEIFPRPTAELEHFLTNIYIFAFSVPLKYAKALRINNQEHKIFTQM